MEKQSAAVSLSSLKSWPWDAREVLSPGTGQACSPQALQQAQPSALKYLEMLPRMEPIHGQSHWGSSEVLL